MKSRLLVFTVIIVLLLTIGPATHAQASTLEFIEHALLVHTWDALDWLGEEYGVFTVGCECYGEVYGNLSVGGFAAPTSATVLVDENLGNTCVLHFESSAYDTVKTELEKRYGNPQNASDTDSTIVWIFREAELRLVFPYDGEFTLRYALLDSSADSQPTFPPPETTAPAPTLEPQTAKLAQENTFAFIEKASVTDSWEALLGLMQQYGLHGYETGCYADISGDLSIAGAAAEVVMILCGDHEDETVYETTGYDYDIWFAPAAYDAVKEALVTRYGEPTAIEDSDDVLVWYFQQTEVSLLRTDSNKTVVCYYLQPTTDASKPSFPPYQATPAPTQTEGLFSSDEGSFLAFVEQASLAYSRNVLGTLGLAYGLDVTENKNGARFGGGLTIGGHTALRVDACSPNGLPGFDCYAYFELDAYDTLRTALEKRYGKPVAMQDVQGDGFAWHFAQADILLRRSVAGMVEAHYAMHPFANEFYPTYPPLLEGVVSGQATQTITYTNASTLEFLEQALQADSWDTLGELGKRYRVATAKDSDYGYNLSGNLSIGGFPATDCIAYDFDSEGFYFSVNFDSNAYDTVLTTLINRYGDPKMAWDYSPGLFWHFNGETVELSRSCFDGGATLSYSISESPDASLPTFPPPQAVTPPSTTIQAPQTVQPTSTTGI